MWPKRLVLENVSVAYSRDTIKKRASLNFIAVFINNIIVKLARDQVKMMGVEENTFERGEVEEVLQRYDQKKTYYIR